jgi:SAM-dependent methyltransferase
MYKLHKFSSSPPAGAQYWNTKYRHKTAEKISLTNPENYRRQLFYPLLMQYLKPGRRYLDAGCGLGGWLLFLRARGLEVEGLDQSAVAIAQLKRIDSKLPVRQGDLKKLPYPPDHFDGILCIGALEYMEDSVAQALREFRRVLKPGGLLFLEVPYENPLRRWTYLPLKTLEYHWKKRRQKPRFAFYLFRKGNVRNFLAATGFHILELKPHELPEPRSHYGLWVDWPFLRGSRPYELNLLGLAAKKLFNTISPWLAATGLFCVARLEEK